MDRDVTPFGLKRPAETLAIAKQIGVTKAKLNHGIISEDGKDSSGKNNISKPIKPSIIPKIPKREILSIPISTPKINVKLGDRPMTREATPTGILGATKVSTDMGTEKPKIPTKKYAFMATGEKDKT